MWGQELVNLSFYLIILGNPSALCGADSMVQQQISAVLKVMPRKITFFLNLTSKSSHEYEGWSRFLKSQIQQLILNLIRIITLFKNFSIPPAPGKYPLYLIIKCPSSFFAYFVSLNYWLDFSLLFHNVIKNTLYRVLQSLTCLTAIISVQWVRWFTLLNENYFCPSLHFFSKR